MGKPVSGTHKMFILWTARWTRKVKMFILIFIYGYAAGNGLWQTLI